MRSRGLDQKLFEQMYVRFPKLQKLFCTEYRAAEEVVLRLLTFG
jgi:hypothetical protein